MNKLWTTIIVIAIAAGAVWWFNGGTGKLSTPGTSASPSVSASATPKVSGQAKTSASPSPMPTSTLSYTQLVQLYANKRFQFDSSCNSQPSSMVLKNGSNILLDNRANETRVIVLNGASYTLPAYGYRVVTVSNSVLPQKIGVTCNGKVNSGMIDLQANISGE